jgi:hypothetical protein
MKIPSQLINNLLKIFYPAVIIFMLIFISINTFAGFDFNLFSIPNVITFIAMFMGQVLLITPYSIAYPFYFFSCFCVTSISTLFWLSRVMPSIPIYLILVSILIVVPLALHLYTRRKNQTIPLLGAFSIFFFALLIIFGVSQTPTASSVDSIFYATLVLFVIISILGLNTTFRTMILNRKLKVSNARNYLRTTKEDLMKKFTSDDAHAEIDLLIYYLSSSFDSFIDGDFERSFMDAYKIAFDNRRKAFKTIYVLPEDKERDLRFSEIRDNLSHAHVREKTKPKNENKEMTKKEATQKETEKEYLKKLKTAQKRLYFDTLDILRIVRYDFIDAALKGKQTQLA